MLAQFGTEQDFSSGMREFGFLARPSHLWACINMLSCCWTSFLLLGWPSSSATSRPRLFLSSLPAGAGGGPARPEGGLEKAMLGLSGCSIK